MFAHVDLISNLRCANIICRPPNRDIAELEETRQSANSRNGVDVPIGHFMYNVIPHKCCIYCFAAIIYDRDLEMERIATKETKQTGYCTVPSSL